MTKVTNKVMSPDEAAHLISDGETICISGLISVLCPEAILTAIENRFCSEGAPKALTVFTPIRVGWGPNTGIEHLAHKGLLKRIVSGTYASKESPRLDEMINANDVEAYCFSMGVMHKWIRQIAAGEDGLYTSVGLGTYVDPRVEGGKLNRVSTDDLVEVEKLGGRELLHYKGFKVDTAIIAGTTADCAGNISLEEEPVTLSILAMAMAAKACGGKVIAEVKRLTANGSIHPRQVAVPGALVDAVVINPDRQQSKLGFNPYWTGEVVLPWEEFVRNGTLPIPLDERKVILRRAAQEINPGYVINLGVGMPVDLPWIAMEENWLDKVTFTTEHGCFGGVPSGVEVFGTHINPGCIMDSPSIFDMYHGGGLDISFLGFAEVDSIGNVNVSKFGGVLRGSGGFIDIIHNTPKIVFCGTMTSGGLRTSIENGKLTVVSEGRHQKFVRQVEQITFSARNALAKSQKVLYVTERAVFELTEEGPVLTEIAPGIDIARHVIPHVAFPLKIREPLKTMEERLFR